MSEDNQKTEVKKQNKSEEFQIGNIEDIVEEVINQNLKEEKERNHQEKDKDKETDIKAIRKLIEPLQTRIMNKIANHNRNVTDLNSTPTMLEAEACARSLQAEFPTLRIDLIVRILHDMFHTQCRKQIENPSEPAAPEVESYPNTKYSITDYSVINSSVRARESINMPIDPRMNEEKRVALSYLNFGYGVRILRDVINDPSMNPTRYNNIITYIMKMTFRKLEGFIKNLGKSIVPINSMEEKIIRAPLTNCEKWMQPQELQVFYRLIKVSCDLDTKLDINPNTAIQLYNSCIKQLQQRQANEQEFKKRGGRKSIKEDQYEASVARRSERKERLNGAENNYSSVPMNYYGQGWAPMNMDPRFAMGSPGNVIGTWNHGGMMPNMGYPMATMTPPGYYPSYPQK